MIETGSPAPLGATPDNDGTNFAIYSEVAQHVELCLFDERGRSLVRHNLPGNTDNVWHGYLPGCKPGQRYGYRVYGIFHPAEGLRCNPNQLLIDPYARALDGEFRWHHAVFDRNALDSAPYVPKCIVVGDLEALPKDRPVRIFSARDDISSG